MKNGHDHVIESADHSLFWENVSEKNVGEKVALGGYTTLGSQLEGGG